MYVLWLNFVSLIMCVLRFGFVFLAVCVWLLRGPDRMPSTRLGIVMSFAGLCVDMSSVLVYLYFLRCVFGYICVARP